MKAAILVVNKNAKDFNAGIKAISTMQSFFTAKNINIVSSLTVLNKPQNILNAFNFVNGVDADKIFIMSDLSDFLLLKNIFSEYCGVSLTENQFAKNALIALAKKFNMSATKKVLDEAKLPDGARALKSNVCLNVGFIANYLDKEWFLMPKTSQELNEMLQTTVVPYLESLFRKNHNYIAIKLFGINESKTAEILSDILNTYKDLDIIIEQNALEVSLTVRYSEITPKVVVDSVTNIIYERLNSYILSDLNLDILSLATELLSIYNKKLAIVESNLQGYLAHNFLTATKDKNNLINECMILNTDESIIKSLNIDKTFIENCKSVADLAYEMAAKLLAKDNADFALCALLTKNENAKYNVCFAVGDIEAIRLYNHEFESIENDAITQINQLAAFYLVKNIKKI